MAKIATTFGLLLILLGLGAYFGTGRTSMTSLIPAAFGVILLAGGIAADKFPQARMHVMHAIVLVALIGLIVSAAKAIPALLDHDTRARVYIQSTMAILCAAFVALSVRSFIQARQQRKSQAAGT